MKFRINARFAVWLVNSSFPLFIGPIRREHTSALNQVVMPNFVRSTSSGASSVGEAVCFPIKLDGTLTASPTVKRSRNRLDIARKRLFSLAHVENIGRAGAFRHARSGAGTLERVRRA